MTRWSENQYLDYLVNRQPRGLIKHTIDDVPPDTGKESRLQSKCESWLKERGFPYFHDRSRKKNRAGWFDLTCILPEGRVVFIELKGGKGRLSQEQQQLIKMAKFLKHEVWEVRSYRQFTYIMTKEGNENG